MRSCRSFPRRPKAARSARVRPVMYPTTRPLQFASSTSPVAAAETVDSPWNNRAVSGLRTVVFDVGGVLIDADDRLLCRKFFDVDADVEFFLAEVLGAEFHHNGLAVRCAQIGRVPTTCRTRGLMPRAV